MGCWFESQLEVCSPCFPFKIIANIALYLFIDLSSLCCFICCLLPIFSNLMPSSINLLTIYIRLYTFQNCKRKTAFFLWNSANMIFVLFCFFLHIILELRDACVQILCYENKWKTNFHLLWKKNDSFGFEHWCTFCTSTFGRAGVVYDSSRAAMCWKQILALM